MTEGPIAKLIIKFALPVFWGNLFQQLYNIVDSLIVGNFAGDEALAAVSSSGSLIFMITGFLLGVFSGSSVVISQYYGAKDKENVQKALHTTIAFAVISGLILALVGIVLSGQILKWMDTPKNVLPNSTLYFRIFFCGSVFSTVYNAGAGVFQAVGDSKHPLYYLIISSFTNVTLDLLFVGIFHYGVAGAAIATIMSQFLSSILVIRRLAISEETYRLHLSKIRIYGCMLKRILRMGIPSGIQNSVIGFANIIVQTNINAFGDLAMAGCGSYSKLEGFAFLPVTSFAMALTTFVGQNIGAGKLDRAKKGARFGAVACALSAELIGVIMFIGMPIFIRAFSQNPKIIEFGTRQAHIECLFFCVLAFSHACAGVMRGAGKAVVPMVVMLMFWCVVRVTYITIVTDIIPRIEVIFWAYPMTWTLSSITFAIYMISGKWLKQKQLQEEAY
ncbi:MAG: MATE family efflux transporter [Lachnospiraceae bacterium]|nr:MATE family efflux transporter [Lachnospiraceae bacterium]